MTREVMENFEDHINSIRVEWNVLKEKWFYGETIDPVFEGVVRDFCQFDDTMHNVYRRVDDFMRGVTQLASGMVSLSDGVSAGMNQTSDHLIASDSCKLKEATNQIARADAPHSAIAKLKRDMQFNILVPVQNHIANNRNLKVSLDVRRRTLVELNTAKKQFDECVRRNLSTTDRRYLQAQATLESAKMTFNDVDRHVFEWLYILEEYRGDILDSTLQTLKYLEYEFFASSAHAISQSLPTRMEFRPMVEMTPEHLEAQVEMELQKSDESDQVGVGGTGAEAQVITDFSARLIDKKAREDPADEGPVLPVDPLSLSSLLSQGFEEGPARKALRKHQNNTQAALDWLINGASEESEKRKLVAEGVRMPTTVKRVQKLKAMRKAQAEKLKAQKEKEEGREARAEASPPAGEATRNARGSGSSSDEAEGREKAAQRPAPAPPPDMLDLLGGDGAAPAPARSVAPPTDLLALDGEEERPTDFSKPVDLTSLPAQLSFDASKCEKPPLAAAVAAGIAQPRDSAPAGAGAPLPPEVLAAAQAIAAQSQITPEQLILAAQQLSQGGLPGAAAAPSAPAGPYNPGPPMPKAPMPQALDPFGGNSPPKTAATPPKPKDSFGDLVQFP